MKSKLKILLVFFMVMGVFFANSAFAIQLKVGTAEGEESTVDTPVSVTIDVTVSDSDHAQIGKISAAAFTLLFDSEALTLTKVESTFFDTFYAQGLLPNSGDVVTVDGEDYESAIASKTFTGKAMIAGAQSQAGDAPGGVDGDPDAAKLFTLTFKIENGAADEYSDKDYPITIQQSVITNTSAGYTSDPLDESNKLPYLVESINDSNVALADSFPPLSPVDTIDGNVKVTRSYVDDDQDGMDDRWEEANFGNTTTAQKIAEGVYTDTDHDGYSDKQEYDNSLAGLTDANGNAYDPWTPNMENEAGYDNTNDFWVNTKSVFDMQYLEQMIAHDKALVLDFGNTYGARRYDMWNGWNHLSYADAVTLIGDVDLNGDGQKQLIGSFVGIGSWVHSYNMVWNSLDDPEKATKTAENMVKYRNGFVADFGNGGDDLGNFQRYDPTIEENYGWSKIAGNANLGKMVAFDIDSDGNDEVVVIHDEGSDWDGLLLYDEDETPPSDWIDLTDLDANLIGQLPEGMVVYRQGVAVDFGALGLWRYGWDEVDQAFEWNQLDTRNPVAMNSVAIDNEGMATVDIDNDGKDELAVVFEDGLQIHDLDNETTPWSDDLTDLETDLAGLIPEGMIRHKMGLAVDFGLTNPDNTEGVREKGGLYLYNDTDQWARLTKADPDFMVSLDFDDDGSEEVAVSFINEGLLLIYDSDRIMHYPEGLVDDIGSWGLWVYDLFVNTSWDQKSSLNPNQVLAVDIDDDGKEEIVGSFPGYGTTIHWEDTGWEHPPISSLTAEDLINYNSQLVGDFGGWGIWRYLVDLDSWEQLIWLNPNTMACVDLDADGTDELVASFPGYGTTVKYEGSDWVHPPISKLTAEKLLRYNNDLVGDFGSWGIWRWNIALNNWQQLSALNPKDMIEADFDNNGQNELWATFPGYGTTNYREDSNNWTHPPISWYVPDELVRFGNGFVGAFSTIGPNGSIWQADPINTKWIKIKNENGKRLTPVDLDGDGIDELAAYLINSGGLFIYSNISKQWGANRISSILPEQLIRISPYVK